MPDSPTSSSLDVWAVFALGIDGCRKVRSDVIEAAIPPASMHLVYESILLRAFRTLETGLEQTFFTYMLGGATVAGTPVASCLQARGIAHVQEVLLGSGSKFVEWTDARTIRNRSLLFFNPENPIDLSLATSAQAMDWMRSLRNHIAHDSVESKNKYVRALESILTVAPTSPPTAGEFLATRPSRGPMKSREPLSYFLDQCEILMKNAVEYAESPLEN